MSSELLTPEERNALAVLARRNRILAIIVPVGVPEDEVKALSRAVNERLDALAAKRGPLQ